MMKNKKAMEWPFQIIIAAVILLIVGGTMLYAWGQASAPLGKELTQKKLQFGQEQCRAKAELDDSLLKNDMDNDGYPDFCDVCPLYDNSVDVDHDYMPDGCDKDPTNTNIFECKHGMDEREQCKGEAKESTLAQRNKIAEDKFSQAMDAFNKGDMDGAEKLLEEITADTEISLGIYNKAQEQYLKIQEIKASKAMLEQQTQSLSKAEQIRKILFAGGIMLSKIGEDKFDEAVDVIKQLESQLRPPFDADVQEELAHFYFVIGDAFLKKNETARASVYFDKVLNNFPNSQSAGEIRKVYTPPAKP